MTSPRRCLVTRILTFTLCLSTNLRRRCSADLFQFTSSSQHFRDFGTEINIKTKSYIVSLLLKFTPSWKHDAGRWMSVRIILLIEAKNPHKSHTITLNETCYADIC